ncbi:hypothetical protein [Peribacillus simplex]|uniref:hypothetical protein n=1 Tax=Peribacillus simplex TaxID=1478 RepID=UPI00333A7008
MINEHESIKFKKTVTKAALNKGAINEDQYELIMQDLKELEEIQKYEEKLKEYRIKEAKDLYSKKLVTI